jgi:hypothetical protein
MTFKTFITIIFFIVGFNYSSRLNSMFRFKSKSKDKLKLKNKSQINNVRL